MKRFLIICVAVCLVVPVAHAESDRIPNKLIDYKGFVEDSEKVWKIRETRRISEEQFIEMAKDENTIILDSRSELDFKTVHVDGAVNLNFSKFHKESLAKVIPSKDTRILIYCNNNFTNNSPSLISKGARAALNIPTFINLYSYGYKNVYELAPAVDIKKTKLPIVPKEYIEELK